MTCKETSAQWCDTEASQSDQEELKRLEFNVDVSNPFHAFSAESEQQLEVEFEQEERHPLDAAFGFWRRMAVSKQCQYDSDDEEVGVGALRDSGGAEEAKSEYMVKSSMEQEAQDSMEGKKGEASLSTAAVERVKNYINKDADTKAGKESTTVSLSSAAVVNEHTNDRNLIQALKAELLQQAREDLGIEPERERGEHRPSAKKDKATKRGRKANKQ